MTQDERRRWLIQALIDEHDHEPALRRALCSG